MAGADPYTLEDAELDIAQLRGQVDQLTEILKITDSAADWGPATAGAWLYSLAGHLKYASADGNAYQTGTLIQQVSPRSQTFNSNTAATILGLSASVAAGTYLARTMLVMEWNSTAGQPELRFAGPAVSQYDITHVSRQSGTSSIGNTASEALAGTGNGTGYNTGFFNPTTAMTATGIFFAVDIWAWFTFTAAGTLTLQAATTTLTSDAWLAFSGIWAVSPL